MSATTEDKSIKAARRARRRRIVRELPKAGQFLADVADLVRRTARNSATEEDKRNDHHIADSLDAFINELLDGRRPAFPAPAQAQDIPQPAQEPQPHARAS